jgi:DNA-directed RNA polymerase sigma subunit (sigma70/sigma32)
MSNIDNLYDLIELLKELNLKHSEIRKRVERGLEAVVCRDIINLKEARILQIRFLKELSLEKSGREFGVTSARIKQIQEKALEKIRVYNNKKNNE